MHRAIFGHSFAVLVAPILLSVLAFNFLNKKRTSGHRNAEDADTNASSSLIVSTEINSGASSSSIAPTETNNCYEVFLSFRGSDTQQDFTDHLYNTLMDVGIYAFRDDDELRQGEVDRAALLEAIKNSKILIPIISMNYGSSSWCLDELVQIMKCKKDNMGQIVLPIFYKVKPADVGHQIGSFGLVFHEREQHLLARRFDPTILQKWKQALFAVSTLKGYEADGNEGELVKSIVRNVWSELKKEFELVIFENLVEIDSHEKKVMKFVDNNSSATPFVSIQRMGGIERTKTMEGTIDKLRQVPHQKVQEKLRISYIALEYRHITCFFIDIDRRITSYKWDPCDFFIDDGIEVLRFMSLIKVGDNHELRMHDQLTDLDREIVHEENQNVLQYHSRLWDSNEVLKVLKENKGADQIKAIYLSKGSLEGSGEIANHGGNNHTDEQFDKLTSLTFFHVSGAHFCGDFKNSFEELRWRRWWNCLLNNFNVKELVALDLSRSRISDKWKGWSFIMMAKKLRFLNLTSCESLRSTVFLSAFKNLEFLILEDCRRLEQIDSSMGDMKLKFLDLTRCESLRSTIFLSAFKNLEFLILKDCWRIEQIDCSIGDMKLKYLDLTSCESLRSTVFLSAFKNLEVLILRDCEEVEQIDSSIGDMKCLVVLDLTGCKSLKELPAEVGKLKTLEKLLVQKIPNISVVPDIGALHNLEILKICRTGIKELPNGIGRLSKLRDLDVSWCKQLQGEMPESFHNLSSLQCLDFDGCKELQLLPDLPSSLTYLSVTCQSRRLPSLSHLTHLKELRLHDCRFLECFQTTDVEESGLAKSLNTPFKLEILKICGCKSMKILDVSQLNHLRILFVEYGNDKLEVRGLDKLKYLESSTIRRCTSI